MLKVKLTSALVGNDHSHAAGDIIETDEAIRLIEAGIAVPYVEAVRETAAMAPVKERRARKKPDAA